MKIREFRKFIKDNKLYLEIVDAETGYSFGCYKINDEHLMYRTRLLNAKIKEISAQYYEGKRFIILKVEV